MGADAAQDVVLGSEGVIRLKNEMLVIFYESEGFKCL